MNIFKMFKEIIEIIENMKKDSETVKEQQERITGLKMAV